MPARDAALDAVPDGRAGAAPFTPRQPALNWRTVAAGLLLMLGAGWAAWWGLGLWQAAQERQHMDQLLAEAAARAQGAASSPAGAASSAPETLGLGVPRSGPAGTPVPDGPAVAAEAAAAPPPVGGVAEALPRTEGPLAGAAPQAPVASAPDASATRPPPTPREAGRRPSAMATASGRDDAGPRPPAPVARAAGLPATPLAACVTQAKSALERCMRQQCARPAWRGHVQCERWLEER